MQDCAGCKLLFTCLDKLAPGGQLINLGDLHELDEIITGPDLSARLTDDATVAGVELGFGEVIGLSGNGPWTVETSDAENHVAQAVVIAKDVEARKRLQVKLERFLAEQFPEAISSVSPLELGPPVGWPIQYRVRGPNNDEVTKIAQRLAQVFRYRGGGPCRP